MKLYLKRTCLFYAYNTLAIFAGELSASIPGILLRAVFEMDAYTTQSYLVYGIGCYLFTVSILLFLMHRDIYENRKFTFTTVVLPAITVCVIRWLIWYITDGKAAFGSPVEQPFSRRSSFLPFPSNSSIRKVYSATCSPL